MRTRVWWLIGLMAALLGSGFAQTLVLTNGDVNWDNQVDDADLYQSRSHSSQKQVRVKTPSLRFPLLAGGTEGRAAWFPSRSGGNLQEGGVMNSGSAY